MGPFGPWPGPFSAHGWGRAYRRFHVELDAFAILRTAGGAASGRLRVESLSRGGIGVLCPARWQPGTEVEVEIHIPRRRIVRRFDARVVHCTEVFALEYLVGCAFARPLGDDELRELL